MKMFRTAVLAVVAFALSTNPVQAQDDPDIVDVLTNSGICNTLVSSVQAAGLVDVLKGEGPFTVFAPTDEAHAALPEGTVESLLLPENLELLASILLYHVVPGAVTAADVVGLESAATVHGASISIGVSDSGVTVDYANVIQTDVAASNGVVHFIDAVILPPELTAVENHSWGTVKQQAH